MTYTPAPQSPAALQKKQDRLLDAIHRQRPELAKKRLAQGASPSLAGGHNMLTPLMVAASTLSGEIINLLAPLNDIAAIDVDGRSALHHFVLSFAHRDYTEPPQDWRRSLGRLLSHETASIKDSQGLTPLLLASWAWRSSNLFLPLRSFSDLISELAPFSDLSATDAKGRTATALALSSGESKSSIASTLFCADPLKDHCLALPAHAEGNLAHLAAANANNGCLAFLTEISAQTNLDEQNSLGRTPLMAAALSQNFLCMDFLLAQGADPRRVDVDGCDALMLAIERLPLDCDDNYWLPLISLASKSDLLARDSLGESALEKATDRRQLSLAGKLDELMGPFGHDAPATASQILPRRKEKLSELLFSAISGSNTLLLEKRLMQGADPKLPLGELSQTPLMAAAGQSGIRSEIIKILRPLSDIAAVDSTGSTALLIYLISHTIDSSEALFNLTELLSPQAALIANHFGQTPLRQLCSNPDFRSSSIDLLGSMSDWKSLDIDGDPVINLYCDHKAFGMALAIFDAHPDKEWLASSKNYAGQTIFHLASKAGNAAILNATASYSLLSSRDYGGNTPLMCILDAMLRPRAPCSEIAKLLAPWSDCRAINDNGCDALMCIIENAFQENDDFCNTAEILASRSNIDARDFLGESALDKALERGFLRTAQIIKAQMAILEERRELEMAATWSRSDAEEMGSPKARI